MKLGYNVSEALQGIRNNLKMTLSSISAISICLLMLGATVILYNVLNEAVMSESKKTQYIAFVSEAVPDDQVPSIQAEMEKIQNVDTVEFVHRDTAKAEFGEFLHSDVLLDLPSEIFRHRYVITLDNNELAEATLIHISLVPGVAEVSGDAVVVEGYNALHRGLRVIAVAIACMLIVISLVVIRNSLTASFERRKRESNIMRLCGVSEAHIRRPLVWEGFIIGIVSAIVAFGLLWFFYHMLYTSLLDVSIAQLLGMNRFLTFGFDIAVIYLISGALLGAVAGRLTSSKKKRRSMKGGVFQG